ncbi:hypothetical protein [Marinomonas colpomeniae]|uniref:PBP family phospholipid-binding protein n=1 Tax=Marinomonas colpomeniae TaxID=2774408 RepID=A0ABR8NWS4_9GAMM|nr:hypothetical protein [Marinomonas colpomeniae]MBD5770506.1 hypothetical protein [Marinomonas colpomeniae]
MKAKSLVTALGLSILSTSALAFDAKLSNSAWDGKTVPAAEQCQKFGGLSPATPELSLMGLPKGTNTIVMEYSDRDSKGMNNGGHGQISYKLTSTEPSAEIPAMLGHTFDLPAPFTMIAAHRGPGWDKAGAYMPPCSGGKDHAYYVTIKAVEGANVLATTVLELGKY